MDTVDFIIQFESGTVTVRQALEFFSDAIRSGLAWQLQGCYGRAASNLIERGLVAKDGTITPAGLTAIEDSE